MKCLLKLILLLYLSRDTSHSPLQGICPSRQYCHSCQRGNVICTVPFNNITALQTGPFAKPIDKLILDGCPDNFTSANTQPNVTSLHINCTINDDYFTLFHRWNLKEIKDINRNELYTQVSPGINQTCRQACGDTKMPVNGTSSCICVGDANEVEADNSNFYYYIIIGGVSAFTLLVNLIFVIGMCTMAQSSLVGVFGIALMFFNILLAFYGLSMAIYLTQNHTYWHHQFCQGFTSVKLFALGGSVWTMLMLTFHRSVRGDIETEREAIFKGIVYILEGLMLSGVLAVMSWIKLDKWNYLCIVFEPKTTVDWLLTGIELLYYFMMLCLVLRFPYHQIRKKKRTGNQRRDTSLPIFLMVIICFLVWVGSYGVTMHWFDYLFTEKIRRVIRVVAIIFPVSLQPIIFILRNTCCCLCRDSPCSKKKDSDLKVCECIPPDQCDICDNEDYVMRYSANETYEKEQPNGDVKEMVDLKAAKKAKKKKEKKEKKEKKKGKGGKFFTPKSIERSPVTKHKETSFNEDGADSDQGGDAVAETPLIDKDNKTEEADRKEEETAQRRSVGIPTDSTPLLDDTDGEARQPPKATPDGTPKKSGVAPDYPSFVHMDSAIDVDSLPKEKAPITLSKLAATNNAVKANKQPQQPQQLQPDLLEEERKSRGPTFFPLAEKKDVPEPKPSKKKTKKKSDKSNGMKNGEKDAPKKSKPKKPNKNERENGEKAPNRNSIVSLEWDHYSDSSSGSVSRSSDYFPDDLTVVPVTETEENNSDQKQTTNTQSNGISRTGSKKSNNMEWDPTGGVESNDELLKNNKNKSEIPTAKTNGKIATAAS